MTDLVAAIDCGTNSIRLYVARVTPTGLEPVDRRLFITRLGQGVDATGRLAPAALERTFAALDDFAAQLARLGGARTRVIATSAARDASNSAEFFDGVLARVGVPAEIITGREEAALSYAGAVAAFATVRPPVLVMDIGGGSTELAFGGAKSADVLAPDPAQVAAPGASGPDAARVQGTQSPSTQSPPTVAVSLDMGSVRLRERYLANDPPAPGQIAEARDFVDDLLDGSGVPFADVQTWIGVGGTATNLAALALGQQTYDADAVQGAVITRSTLDALTTRLLSMPVAEVAALPTMVPGRADVICAGALICSAVGARVGKDLRASEADLLDGIAAQLASG